MFVIRYLADISAHLNWTNTECHSESDVQFVPITNVILNMYGALFDPETLKVDWDPPVEI